MKNKEAFTQYMDKCSTAAKSAVKYVNGMKRISMTLSKYHPEIESFLDIDDSTEAEKYKALLLNDKEFIEYNRNGVGNNMYSGALEWYIRFLQAKELFANFSAMQEQAESNPIKKSSLPLQVIYYGAPGTGKSYRIDREAPEELTVRTTFHPDSDYAGFVGAYKPTMESVPMTAFMGKEVHRATPTASHTGMERKIVYKFVPQAFLKAYVEAWSDLERPHFLVIEEINRGNCAQVFGDLFQLLDRNDQGASAYAIAADEDVAAFLRDDARGFANLSDSQRAAIEEFVLVKDSGQQWTIGRDILEGRKLLLPPNLHIWATMNTSDQSLFPIDSAFKRRWNWRFVPIDYAVKQHLFEVGGKRYSWGDFLYKVNPIIHDLTESADKQMGYFFAKPDLCSSPASGERDLISEEVFVNKVLFYLWTDVLKDFEPQAPFVDDAGKLYKFSDFFDPSTGALQRFMDGLKLEEVATAEVDAEGEESESVEA